MRRMEDSLLKQLKPNVTAVDYSDLCKFVDEPDGGMDQNLPDSDDPENQRRWMGGKVGLGSQGFRHMYFGGWDWQLPIGSLQLPFHAIGYAPDRVEEFSEMAQRFFREGNRPEGLRRLAWALHYLQDLGQPYHATQLPLLSFLKLRFSVQRTVEDTTHNISNYHLSMENYVAERLQSSQAFGTCFPSAPNTSLPPEPKRLALFLAELSRGIAQGLARSQSRFFQPMEVTPTMDFTQLVSNGNKKNEMKQFEDEVCLALQNTTQASIHLIRSILNIQIRP